MGTWQFRTTIPLSRLRDIPPSKDIPERRKEEEAHSAKVPLDGSEDRRFIEIYGATAFTPYPIIIKGQLKLIPIPTKFKLKPKHQKFLRNTIPTPRPRRKKRCQQYGPISSSSLLVSHLTNISISKRNYSSAAADHTPSFQFFNSSSLFAFFVFSTASRKKPPTSHLTMRIHICIQAS